MMSIKRLESLEHKGSRVGQGRILVVFTIHTGVCDLLYGASAA